VWRSIDDRAIPAGLVATDGRCEKVIFGVRTVRAWKLDQYQSATVKTNDTPGLVAFQFYTDGQGARVVTRVGIDKKTRRIACAGILHSTKPHGRYLAKQESAGFVVVDFSHQAPQGWKADQRRNK